MADIECPYCGEEQDINHDDGYGYDEDNTHNQTCVACDKNFAYTTSVMFLYEAARADCLNGADHAWYPAKTFPVRYTKMRCRDCGEERVCTEDELADVMARRGATHD